MRTYSAPYFFASTFIFATLGQSCHSQNNQTPDDPKIRREVLRIIQDHYFESSTPDTSLPTKKFITNLDPFSFYFSRSEYEKSELHSRDQDFRYGVSIIATGGHLILAQVLPQSAAEHAGLLVGDELVAISNRALNGSDSLAAAILTKSTSAEFDILRGNSMTIRRLTVQKGVLEQSSVPIAAMFDSAIGYIQVTGFNHGTAAKIIEAMHSLSRQGMRAAIIDLRFNSGGFVTETLSALNIFVHSDKPVLHETLRDPNYNNESTLPEEAIYPILPLAVLVGNNTCSAAEMFSGVLQDLDRATIANRNGACTAIPGVATEDEKS